MTTDFSHHVNKVIYVKMYLVSSCNTLKYVQYVFNVHFWQPFLWNSVKILHRPRANDQIYPLLNYQNLVSKTYQCNPGLKMPVSLICTKICIVVNSFLNKRNKKIVHETCKILSQKMETITVKTLQNWTFFFYFFTQSKKLSANKNWQFQTRTSLASLWNQILIV